MGPQRKRRVGSVVVLVAACGLHKAAGSGGCPNGYYRSSPIVWTCQGGQGRTKVALCEDRQNASLRVPAFVADFSSEIVAQTDVDLSLYDETTRKTIASFDEAMRRSVSGGSTYTAEYPIVGGSSITLSFSGNQDLPIKENITAIGVFMEPMLFVLENHQSSFSVVDMSYSYASQNPCPSTPAGCREYDPDEARKVALPWSRWAQTQVDTASEAWNALSSLHGGGSLQWATWECVWLRWPAAPPRGEWPLTFAYLDHDMDDALSREEFDDAFYLYQWTKEELKASIADWSGHMQRRMPETQAWTSLSSWSSGGEADCVSKQTWLSSVWQSWKPADGELKVPGGKSFEFCDSNSDLCLSQAEFAECYNSHRPVPSATPSPQGMEPRTHAVPQVAAASTPPLAAAARDGGSSMWWLPWVLASLALLALCGLGACVVLSMGKKKRVKGKTYRALPKEDLEEPVATAEATKGEPSPEPENASAPKLDALLEPSPLDSPMLTKPCLPPILPNLGRPGMLLPNFNFGSNSSPKATGLNAPDFSNMVLQPTVAVPPMYHASYRYRLAPVYRKVSVADASLSPIAPLSPRLNAQAGVEVSPVHLASPPAPAYPVEPGVLLPEVSYPSRAPLAIPPPLEDLIPQYAAALRSPAARDSPPRLRSSSSGSGSRQTSKSYRWEDTLRK